MQKKEKTRKIKIFSIKFMFGFLIYLAVINPILIFVGYDYTFLPSNLRPESFFIVPFKSLIDTKISFIILLFFLLISFISVKIKPKIDLK